MGTEDRGWEQKIKKNGVRGTNGEIFQGRGKHQMSDATKSPLR